MERKGKRLSSLKYKSLGLKGKDIVIRNERGRIRTLRLMALLVLVLSFGGCGEKSVDQLIADAKQERAKGDYKSTIVHLKTALQESSDNPEARYLLGVTYNDIGDFQAGETELRRAIDLGFEAGKVAIGRSLLMTNQYQKLLDEVQPNPKLDNAVQAEILTLRARALFGLGRLSEGRQLLEQALVIQPEFADALLVLARLAARERDTDEVLRLIERALVSMPRSIEAWLMKGDLARVNADLAGALSAYQKAVEINAESVPARVRITFLQIGAGNLDDARKQLDQIRKVAPNFPLAKYLLALIELRQKNYTAARDAVLQALKVMPDHLPTTLLAGAVEYHLGAHIQAQSHLQRALERAPRYIPARRLLIASFAKSGEMQRAIEVLQVGIQQAPEDSALLALAGELYLQSGDFAKATQYFERAVERAPTDARARTGLGLSQLVSGETGRAVADLESAVQIDTESYQADILLVISHLQSTNYDQALKAIESLEKKQPKNPLTFNLKALIYSGKKDLATARKYLEHAIELSPTYFAAAQNLAQLDLQNNKPADARRRFEAILEKDKNNTQSLLALAEIAPRIGATPKEVFDWLERARKASPGSPQPKIRLAYAYAQSGNPKRALDIAQQAAAEHSENADVLDALGAIQIAVGAKEQALTTYHKLVSLQPNSAVAFFRLATAHAANGDNARAATTFRKAVALQPGFIDAHVALAGLELKAKRYPAAMKIARDMQKQFSKSPAGFLIEGDILMEEKKFSQAAKAFEAAYSLGRSGLTLIKMHKALAQAGRPSDAEERLLQGIEEFPDDATLRTYTAETSMVNGKYQTAIAQYEWLLRQEPNDWKVLNNLAWTYQQVKDRRALETAERAYKLQPNNPVIADTLGWMLVEQGDTKRGIEILRKAVTAAPHVTEFRYHLAQALAKANDPAKAKQELRKLLADAPDSRFSKEARQLLSDLNR